MEDLILVFSHWPFAKWGIDLIGPLPTGKGGVKFAIVAADYFTKRAKTEPLTKITKNKTINFVWKSLIYRFGIPHSIVTDNGKYFDSQKFKSFCSGLHSQNHFSTLYHPQSNGQVETVNKIIKNILRARLDQAKGIWAEELPGVFWAYWTTHQTAMGETPFSLAFSSEAVIPIRIGVPIFRVEAFEES